MLDALSQQMQMVRTFEAFSPISQKLNQDTRLRIHWNKLLTTGNISGVISERDYISKIALLGRVSKETMVKEISTKSSNLMTASPHDSVDECMEKMLAKDVRHLPLLDDDGKVIGMLSVRSYQI